MPAWLPNALLALAVLATLVAGGELAVRTLAPFPSWEHERSCAFPDRFDPRLGWSGIPDHDAPFAQREFEIRVQTNAAGFRDADFAAKRARAAGAGSRRVALLGDSFVWGWGVEADERVGEQLEAQARGAGALTTFNLAQCGWGTDQQYLAYLAHADAIRPELALLFFFANDFADVSAAARYEGQAKPRFVLGPQGLALANVPVPHDAEHWARKRALAGRRGSCPARDGAERDGDRPAGAAQAALARAASRLQVANWLRFRTGQLGVTPAGAGAPAPAPGAASLRLATALIDALAGRVARDGARFALVLVPEKEQVLAGTREGAWQQRLLAHCARAGLACLDLLPAFAGDASRYFRIDPHWNAAGHRLAAERLQAFVAGVVGDDAPPYTAAPRATRP